MLLFLFLTLIGVSSSEALQVIQVDPVTGVNNKTCWTGSVPCGSFNYALGGVVNNTRLQLASGSFNLSTHNTTLIGLSSITIEGTGYMQTIVTCYYSDVGLYFVKVDHLTIANLTVSNCGMLQNSTTWNTSSPVPLKYPSAVAVYNSSNVVVYSVKFQHNNGIGLSIVNSGGMVTISNSVFDSNYVSSDGEYPGGGGLYIEFPFCLPEFPNALLSSNSQNSHSQYTVDSCYFTNNIAKKVVQHYNSNVSLFSCAKETFGRGGGMSIFFRGYSTNNTITITNTVFTSNVAEWGGGLLIEFNHYSSKNTVLVNGKSQFSDNHCVDSSNHSDSGGGGGVQIVYSSFENINSPGSNEVSFSHCDFTGNTAYWGGGVSYLIVKEQQQLATNTLHFNNCSWQRNVARFGAALDLSLYQSLASGVVQPVLFDDCLFVENSLSSPVGQFELQGIGTLYANSIVVKLKGSVLFNANDGSALVISAAGVDVEDNCVLVFTNNKAQRGAAVYLLASSWINIRDNTTITFTDNKADEMGGAIHAELINEHNVVATWNCFFQYFNATVEPDEWNTKILFQNNIARHRGHSIYATTLQSCLWGKSYTHVTQDDIKNAFHWKSFEFDGKSGTKPFSREMEVATAANFLSTNKTDLKIAPGRVYHLPFNQSDDEGQRAKAVFFIQSNDETTGKIGNRSVYVFSDIMQVYGEPESTFSITVTSLGPISSAVTLNVTFDHCPPGYIPYDESCKCATEESGGYPGISGCDDEKYQANITRYHWGGIHLLTNEFVTSLCPQGFCNFAKSQYEMPLPNSRTQLDESQCQPQHRTGTICGECMDGYSMSSESNCIGCDHGTMKGILFFLLYECVPTLVFVSIILFFNINITSGHWNSLIFYFQILETLNLYALRTIEEFSKPIQILIKIHTTLFGIWNLDFFRYFKPDVCYIKGMKNVFEVFALKYFTVLFAFGLIVLVAMFKNFRCFNCVCCYRETNVQPGRFDYFKQKCAAKWKKLFGRTSLIHGLAAFIVLSYTKIALLSMYFFIPGQIYRHGSEVVETRLHHVGTITYGSKEHLVYAVPAFVLIAISAMLPGYLILKPLVGKKCGNIRLCQNCYKIVCCCVRQDKLDQLLEEFYGSFKKDCRFYAGFFFLYRFALYVTLTFTTTLQIQYAVQQCLLGGFLFLHSLFQPYNERYQFANKLDALIFMNLIVINALSVYNLYSVFDVQGESGEVIAIQMVLVYLPLVYVLFRFVWWLKKTCTKFCDKDDGERIHLLQHSIIVDPEGDRERIAVELQDSTNLANTYVVVENDDAPL